MRCAIGIVYEGDEFHEQSLPAHTELFAKPLAGQVIVLGVGVYASRAFFPEQIIEISMGGLICRYYNKRLNVSKAVSK